MGRVTSRRNRGSRGGSPGTGKEASLGARARAFAFEGLPERDRFGVFDPLLRGMYLFGMALGAVLAGAFVLETGRGGAAPGAAALLLALGVAWVGFVGYRRVWPRPAERELLLRMAREDDEARREREARARNQAGRP